MNDLLLRDCVCTQGLWVYRHCISMFVWDMMQTEQAVLLLCLFLKFCPKITTQTHSKTHFLCHPPLSHSCSNGFHWHHIQRFILPKQIQLMQTTWDCYRKKKAARYHCWADVKNAQTDLIPYLHLKDHSTFKHKLMMHNAISISSKCLQRTFHL